MTPLTLVLRHPPGGPLDLGGITPAALLGKSMAAIAKLRLGSGRRPPALGDVFDISGNDPSRLRFHGLNAACQRLGADMDSGRIEASGMVGDELGRGMRGGEVVLRGNAGDAVGAGMRGGRIVVRGSVGRRLGGVVAGATTGMNGGVILVTRDAGDSAGERMRRGLILIGGDAGRHLGDRLVAGTIAVLGQAGAGPGAGMRRGTLMLAHAPAQMTPTFNECGEFELPIMTLIQRHVAEHSRPFARQLAAFRRARRWCGDMAFGGKGELFIPGDD